MSEGYRNSTDDISEIAILAFQVPVIEIKCKEAKERNGKLKNPQETDKTCLQKMECKLETARTYPIFHQIYYKFYN